MGGEEESGQGKESLVRALKKEMAVGREEGAGLALVDLVKV